MNDHARSIGIALRILALLSVGALALTAVSYVQGTKAVGGLRFQVSALELHDEEDPEVLVTLQLQNGSPTDAIEVDVLDFSLYLNDNFVGSNYAPFSGITVRESEQTAMDFVIPIRPFYHQHIEQARQSESFAWSLRGQAKLVLPSSKDKEFWIAIRDQWSGDL